MTVKDWKDFWSVLSAVVITCVIAVGVVGGIVWVIAQFPGGESHQTTCAKGEPKGVQSVHSGPGGNAKTVVCRSGIVFRVDS